MIPGNKLLVVHIETDFGFSNCSYYLRPRFLFVVFFRERRAARKAASSQAEVLVAKSVTQSPTESRESTPPQSPRIEPAPAPKIEPAPTNRVELAAKKVEPTAKTEHNLQRRKFGAPEQNRGEKNIFVVLLNQLIDHIDYLKSNQLYRLSI